MKKFVSAAVLGLSLVASHAPAEAAPAPLAVQQTQLGAELKLGFLKLDLKKTDEKKVAWYVVPSCGWVPNGFGGWVYVCD